MPGGSCFESGAATANFRRANAHGRAASSTHAPHLVAQSITTRSKEQYFALAYGASWANILACVIELTLLRRWRRCGRRRHRLDQIMLQPTRTRGCGPVPAGLPTTQAAHTLLLSRPACSSTEYHNAKNVSYYCLHELCLLRLCLSQQPSRVLAALQPKLYNAASN